MVIYCPKCKAPRPLHSVQWFCCAECGTPTYEVVAGQENFVTALEMRQEKGQDVKQEMRKDDSRTAAGGSRGRMF